jgi:hypothetical protein
MFYVCLLCNKQKADRVASLDPITGAIVLLFNPRYQIWHDHFAWIGEGERIIGLTPVGRATVAALNLNRSSLVKARQLWARAGWHPPED